MVHAIREGVRHHTLEGLVVAMSLAAAVSPTTAEAAGVWRGSTGNGEVKGRGIYVGGEVYGITNEGRVVRGNYCPTNGEFSIRYRRQGYDGRHRNNVFHGQGYDNRRKYRHFGGEYHERKR